VGTSRPGFTAAIIIFDESIAARYIIPDINFGYEITGEK
jgi:hypothetical protein